MRAGTLQGARAAAAGSLEARRDGSKRRERWLVLICRQGVILELSAAIDVYSGEYQEAGAAAGVGGSGWKAAYVQELSMAWSAQNWRGVAIVPDGRGEAPSAAL